MIRMILWGELGIGLDCLAFILRRHHKIDVLAWGDDLDHLRKTVRGSVLDAVLVVDDLPPKTFVDAPNQVREAWDDVLPVAVTHRTTGTHYSAAELADYAGALSIGSHPDTIVEKLEALVQAQDLADPSDQVPASEFVDLRGPKFNSSPDGKAKGLTAREQTVLKHIALGYSARDTAQILGLNSRTVDAHRRRVSAKLGLSTVADLTKHSIAVGLIDVQSDELYAQEHQHQMELVQ